jgi:hypothetical protein
MNQLLEPSVARTGYSTDMVEDLESPILCSSEVPERTSNLYKFLIAYFPAD